MVEDESHEETETIPDAHDESDVAPADLSCTQSADIPE